MERKYEKIRKFSIKLKFSDIQSQIFFFFFQVFHEFRSRGYINFQSLTRQKPIKMFITTDAYQFYTCYIYLQFSPDFFFFLCKCKTMKYCFFLQTFVNRYLYSNVSEKKTFFPTKLSYQISIHTPHMEDIHYTYTFHVL